jgi:hypothetical protein
MSNERSGDVSQLRDECEFAEQFFGRLFAGLTLTTMREYGEPAGLALWEMQQGDHQGRYYLAGLKKLGIDRDPPAVAAAKYHYFSNSLGGLEVQYIEESPRRAWIRYPAPIWTFPGISLMSVSGSFRRNVFASWHRNNGVVSNNPRLGWVSTKFIMDGDPYDEGYFEEFDHDLNPAAPLMIRRVSSTPEFDPSTAPRLDEAEWPEARKLKARRNYSRGYYRGALESLEKLYSLDTAYWLLRLTIRTLAVQYIREWSERFDITGNSLQDVLAVIRKVLQSCEQSVSVITHGTTFELHVGDVRDVGARSDQYYDAYFAFFQTAVAVLNGRIRIERRGRTPDRTADIWTIEDTGRWLW